MGAHLYTHGNLLVHNLLHRNRNLARNLHRDRHLLDDHTFSRHLHRHRDFLVHDFLDRDFNNLFHDSVDGVRNGHFHPLLDLNRSFHNFLDDAIDMNDFLHGHLHNLLHHLLHWHLSVLVHDSLHWHLHWHLPCDLDLHFHWDLDNLLDLDNSFDLDLDRDLDNFLHNSLLDFRRGPRGRSLHSHWVLLFLPLGGFFDRLRRRGGGSLWRLWGGLGAHWGWGRGWPLHWHWLHVLVLVHGHWFDVSHWLDILDRRSVLNFLDLGNGDLHRNVVCDRFDRADSLESSGDWTCGCHVTVRSSGRYVGNPARRWGHGCVGRLRRHRRVGCRRRTHRGHRAGRHGGLGDCSIGRRVIRNESVACKSGVIHLTLGKEVCHLSFPSRNPVPRC
mmetsp:Transcript_28783/g.58999  ORF Transcript_28783/g.58999 Transcript_28783/m.58999 type:complete len:387 (+) Transcript_28783:911-2071(+)